MSFYLFAHQLKLLTDLDDSQCTHGKLYVLDNTTSLIHVIDVHEGNLENLSVGQTVDVGAGAGELVYYGQPGDPLVVQFRGEEPDFDGFVRVIDTGYSYVDEILYADPSIVQNALIECNRPIHQVRMVVVVSVSSLFQTSFFFVELFSVFL